jgi:hypothetical protein
VECEESNLRELSGGGYGSLDGVGDVVKLQIEKDACCESREPFDRSGAFGREELAPDLEKTRCAIQSSRQSTGRTHAAHVEGDN